MVNGDGKEASVDVAGFVPDEVRNESARGLIKA